MQCPTVKQKVGGAIRSIRVGQKLSAVFPLLHVAIVGVSDRFSEPLGTIGKRSYVIVYVSRQLH